MENMTSKELKAMAKELGVKNWWTLKKAELIAEIEAAQKVESETVEETPETTENVADDKNIVEAAQNDSKSTENELVPMPGANRLEELAKEYSQPAEKKSSNKKVDLIEYNGKTQSLSAWARELDMPGQTLYARLRISNWPVEKAFTTPTRKKKTDEE